MIRLIIMVFVITAYCDSSCDKAPGHAAYGVMVSGKATYQGAMACPSWMPLGTKVFLEGERYTCEDRGGAITSNRLDIWFASCNEAMEWGRKEIEGMAMLEGGGKR